MRQAVVSESGPVQSICGYGKYSRILEEERIKDFFIGSRENVRTDAADLGYNS